jgi:preprotein translocase subunit SecF
MIESGMLALLIAVLVISIYVIRKTKSWGYIGIADDAS